MQSISNMKKEQEEQVSKKEPVYLDANCFIYASTDESKIGQKARKIIQDIKIGVYEKAYSSTLTVDEFLWSVQKEVGRELAAEGADIFLTLQNFQLINIDAEIISKAINLYKEKKLDPRDAIHLAAMQSKNIKTIISSDPDFDKIKSIKRNDFSIS